MNRSLSRRERAQVCFEAGAALLAQRANAAALSEFGKAVALNPLFAAAHLGHARAARQLGDWVKAEASARAALAAEPRFPEAAHFLGAILVELDRLSEALPTKGRAFGIHSVWLWEGACRARAYARANSAPSHIQTKNGF